jgi:hypothetical protein
VVINILEKTAASIFGKEMASSILKMKAAASSEAMPSQNSCHSTWSHNPDLSTIF